MIEFNDSTISVQMIISYEINWGLLN